MTTPSTTGRKAGTGLSARIAADLRAYRCGDHDAMAALVRSVTPLLWHVARAFRLDASSAEDVVQNTLLALVRHSQDIAEPHAALSSALGMPIGSIGPTRGRCLAKLRLLLASDPEWGAS